VYLISDGCVGLISSGRSSEESAFLDASESGDDVFFLTTERLSSKDSDGRLDVYDAHVCSAREPCLSAVVVPVACEQEGCQGVVAQQPGVFAAPPSSTFNGSGNATPPKPIVKAKPLTRAQKLSKALKACKRDVRQKKRVACERAARKRYGPVKKHR
jgi:hypothetical protein